MVGRALMDGLFLQHLPPKLLADGLAAAMVAMEETHHLEQELSMVGPNDHDGADLTPTKRTPTAYRIVIKTSTTEPR